MGFLDIFKCKVIRFDDYDWQFVEINVEGKLPRVGFIGVDRVTNKTYYTISWGVGSNSLIEFSGISKCLDKAFLNKLLELALYYHQRYDIIDPIIFIKKKDKWLIPLLKHRLTEINTVNGNYYGLVYTDVTVELLGYYSLLSQRPTHKKPIPREVSRLKHLVHEIVGDTGYVGQYITTPRTLIHISCHANLPTLLYPEVGDGSTLEYINSSSIISGLPCYPYLRSAYRSFYRRNRGSFMNMPVELWVYEVIIGDRVDVMLPKDLMLQGYSWDAMLTLEHLVQGPCTLIKSYKVRVAATGEGKLLFGFTTSDSVIYHTPTDISVEVVDEWMT